MLYNYITVPGAKNKKNSSVVLKIRKLMVYKMDRPRTWHGRDDKYKQNFARKN
jgi:hypothetical protein